MAVDEICEIEVGYDRFRAHLIIEACDAAGVTVRLRQMDENGLTPGFAALQPHRILVKRMDVPIALEIVGQSLMTEPESRAWTNSPGPERKLLAWSFIAVLLVPLLLVFVQVAGRLL